MGCCSSIKTKKDDKSKKVEKYKDSTPNRNKAHSTFNENYKSRK